MRKCGECGRRLSLMERSNPDRDICGVCSTVEALRESAADDADDDRGEFVSGPCTVADLMDAEARGEIRPGE